LKKLILLNAALLLALFSIKFSHENLYERLRAFRGEGEIASGDPLPEEETPILEIVSAPEEEVTEVQEETPQIELVSIPEEETPQIELVSIPEEELVKEETPQQRTFLDSFPEVLAVTEVPSPEIAVEERTDQAPPEPLPVITFQEVSASAFRSDEKIEKKESGSSFPYPKRILLSHTEGYGEHEKPYRTNYSLAEIVFAPDARPGHALPMIDFRAYRFDNAKYAISAGLGFRYIPGEENSFCNLLGMNIYYDYAPDTPGFHQQMGAGVEILGKRLDFRANFYAPFGDRDDFDICCDRTLVNGWLSSGFNVEVGYLAYQTKSFFLYTAIGPYYVTACKCQERQRGIALRVFPQYKDFVGLNLKYSYDPLFKSIFQAEIIISLPFYQISSLKKTPCGITNRQIYQRVERR